MTSAQLAKLKFSRISKAVDEDILWQPIQSSQHTNMLWTAEVADRKVVLRLNAPEQKAFGVSRHAEQRVLSIIAGHDWAPDIIECNPDQGWCLMSYHGASLNELSAPSMEDLAHHPSIHTGIATRIKKMICEIQHIKIGPATDYSALLKRYRHRLTKTSGNQSGENWQEHLHELESLLITFADLPKCLVHHDLHPGNICWREDLQQLVVIDWEYAGIGIPWLDTAQLVKHGLLSEYSLELLPSCQNLSRATIKTLLDHALRMNELLEQLWWLVQKYS
jgi:thiamine kinase